MKEYKVGDTILIRDGRTELKEVKIVEVKKGPFRKVYVVKETYRHMIEGVKNVYREIKSKHIICLKGENF